MKRWAAMASVLGLLVPAVPTVASAARPDAAGTATVRPRAAVSTDPNDERARHQVATLAAAVGELLDGVASDLGDRAERTGDLPLVGTQIREVFEPVRTAAAAARDALVNDIAPFVDGADDEAVRRLLPAAVFVLLGPKDALTKLPADLQTTLAPLAPLNTGADLVVGANGAATPDDVHVDITDNDMTLRVTLGQTFDVSLGGISLTPTGGAPADGTDAGGPPPKVTATDYLPAFGDQLGVLDRLHATATWRARLGVGLSVDSLPYVVVPDDGAPLADATVTVRLETVGGAPVTNTPVDLGLMRVAVSDGAAGHVRVSAAGPLAFFAPSRGGVVQVSVTAPAHGDVADPPPTIARIFVSPAAGATLAGTVVALNAGLVKTWGVPPVEFVAEPRPDTHDVHLVLVARDPEVTGIHIDGGAAFGFVREGQDRDTAPPAPETSQVLLTAGVSLAGAPGDHVVITDLTGALSAFVRADARVRLHVDAVSGSVTDAIGAAVASAVGDGKFAASWPELSFDLRFDASAGLSTENVGAEDETPVVTPGRLQFDDVKLDLRSFFRGVVLPFAHSALDAVRPLTEALGAGGDTDANGVLDKPIPVVSDLAAQRYTLRDFDRDVLGGKLADGGLDTLLAFLRSIGQLPDTIEKNLAGVADGAVLDIGCIEPDLDEDHATYIGKIRAPVPCELVDLEMSAKALADQTVNVDSSVTSTVPSDVVDLDFLSDVRGSAFKLITGRPVTLASIGLPKFAAAASGTASFDLDVVSASVAASVAATSNVRVGYDTTGIADVLRQVRAGQAPDLSALTKGFYVTTGSCNPQVDLDTTASAGELVKGCALGVAARFDGKARIGPAWGQVALGAALAFTIGDTPGTGVLRGDQLAALTSNWEHPEQLLCLLDIKASGAVSAAAGLDPDISVTLPSVGGDVSLRALLSDAFGVCQSGAPAAAAAPEVTLAGTVRDDADATLRVHVGPYASLRAVGAVDRGPVRVALAGDATTVTVAVGTDTQTFTGPFDRVLVEGTPFDDTIDASGLSVRADLRGDGGNDTIIGGNAGDRIDGGAGDDTDLRGGPGDDVISGGPGADQIDGGEGNDDLRGGAGRDTIVDGAGADRIDGGDGADDLTATDDGTVVRGGLGDDAITAGAGVTVDGGLGADTLVLAGGGPHTLARAAWFAGGPADRRGLLGIESVSGTGTVVVDDADAPLRLLAGFEGVTVRRATATITVVATPLTVDRRDDDTPVVVTADRRSAGAGGGGVLAGVAPADVVCEGCTAATNVLLGAGADTVTVRDFPAPLTVDVGAGADRITMDLPGNAPFQGGVTGGDGAAATIVLRGTGSYARTFPRGQGGALVPLLTGIPRVALDASAWSAAPAGADWKVADDVVSIGTTPLVDVGTPNRLDVVSGGAHRLVVDALDAGDHRVGLTTGAVAFDVARAVPGQPDYTEPPLVLPVHAGDEIAIGRVGTRIVDVFDEKGTPLGSFDLTGRTNLDVNPVAFGPNGAKVAVVHGRTATRLVVVDTSGGRSRAFAYDLGRRGPVGQVLQDLPVNGTVTQLVPSPASRAGFDGRSAGEIGTDGRLDTDAANDEVYALQSDGRTCRASRLTFAADGTMTAKAFGDPISDCDGTAATVGRFDTAAAGRDRRALAVPRTGRREITVLTLDGTSVLTHSYLHDDEFQSAVAPDGVSAVASADCPTTRTTDRNNDDAPSRLLRVTSAAAFTSRLNNDGVTGRFLERTDALHTSQGRTLVPGQLRTGRFGTDGPSLVVPATDGSVVVMKATCHTIDDPSSAKETLTSALAVGWRPGDELAVGDLLPDAAAPPVTPAAVPADETAGTPIAHPLTVTYGPGINALTVRTGAGRDVVTVDDLAVSAVVSTGAGRDVVTLTGGAGDQSVLVQTGDGRDSVAVRATGADDRYTVDTGADVDDVVTGPLGARSAASVAGGPASQDPAAGGRGNQDTLAIDPGVPLAELEYQRDPERDLPVTPKGFTRSAAHGTVSYDRVAHVYLWVAPVARLAAPATATVGAAFKLDASASTTPAGGGLRYRFDTDGDGVPDTPISATPTITVTPTRAGRTRYGVQVTDDVGRASATTVAVDVAAAVTPVAGPAVVGAPVRLTVPVDLVGGPAVAFTVDWGDGAGPQRTAATDLTHVYARAGSAPVKVSQAFAAGAPDVAVAVTGTTTVAVVERPSVTGPARATQGAPVSLQLAAPGLPSGTWDLRWSDGAREQVTGATVSHVFARPGLGTVDATYVPASGPRLTARRAGVPVVPADRAVALTVTGEAGGRVDEGPRPVALAATIPAATTGVRWRVDWGDGSAPTVLPGGATARTTHTFVPGATRVTATLEDTDGAHAATKDLTVADVAPVITGVRVLTAVPTEGGDVRLAVDATDPGSAPGSLRYEFFFTGAGTPDMVSADGTGAHTFAEHTTATARVRVVDAGGHAAERTVDLTIANAAPVLVVHPDDGVGNGTEGTAVTLHVGVVDIGHDKATGFTVDWGDGTSQRYRVGDPVTHVYADGAAVIDRTPDPVRWGRNPPPFVVHGTPYTVTVHDVVDPTGPAGGWPNVRATTAFEVHDAPPTVDVAVLVGVGTANAARPALQLGTITDPGTDTVTAYGVQWDDDPTITYVAGKPAPGTVVEQPAGRRAAARARVILEDEDGRHLAATVDLRPFARLGLRVRRGSGTVSRLAGAVLRTEVVDAFVDGIDPLNPPVTYAVTGLADTGATTPAAGALTTDPDAPTHTLMDTGVLGAGTFVLRATGRTASGQAFVVDAAFAVKPAPVTVLNAGEEPLPTTR